PYPESSKLWRFLQMVPENQYFGKYRSLPFFFLLRRNHGEIFYAVYHRKQSQRQCEQRKEGR
uniref:Uncharacterized protein n=1 Tax=Chelydra serpentina TaxID=8475 RepID=A0A8C3RRW0_CHESE